jgi:Fur family peroxide stress response transcriptional regulator
MDQFYATKNSAQREAVKSAILDRFDHPTAEDVYLTVRKSCPRISLATVYRNLDRLVDEGLVDKFVVPGEPDHYDPVRGEHYHVRCRHCDKIYDIDAKIAKKMAALIKSQTGVSMKSLQLIADGICENCDCNNGKETS